MWLVYLLVACRGEPAAGDEFVGPDFAQSAIRCQGRVIPSLTEWWTTFTIRSAPGVEVDWSQARVPLSHAVLVREDAPIDSTDADGWSVRMRTLWLKGAPPPGEGVANAQIGPHLVPVRKGADGDWIELAGTPCRPSVERE